MAATGAGLDPRRREFDFLVDDAEARRSSPTSANTTRRCSARLAFTVAADELMPEGQAWSARPRQLYLGAIGRIVAVDEHGAATTLAREPSFAALLGLRVGDARGELWAVASPSASPAPAPAPA